MHFKEERLSDLYSEVGKLNCRAVLKFSDIEKPSKSLNVLEMPLIKLYKSIKLISDSPLHSVSTAMKSNLRH